jgi:hypothetical protein
VRAVTELPRNRAALARLRDNMGHQSGKPETPPQDG